MNIFNDILRRARDAYAYRFEPEGIYLLATMYWRILVGTGAVLVVLSLAFGLWNLFGVVDTLSSLPDTSPLPPAAFSRAALHNVATGFSTRQTQFEAGATQSASAVPDPSK